MREYVLGFLFSPDLRRVALVEKKHPAWKASMWNGVGGRVDPGETPAHAMTRKFLEEAGIDISTWRHFATMKNDKVEVFCFEARDQTVEDVQAMTDEDVRVFDTLRLPHTLYNLRWLLPLARDNSTYGAVVWIR